MEKVITILGMILGSLSVSGQVGGICMYTLPDSTEVCYQTNAGVNAQNTCLQEAVDLFALPYNPYDSPLVNCASTVYLNGVAGFWTGTGNCVSDFCSIYLPVELSDFYGDCGGVGWVTASEFNNDYFTLESSKDGQFWKVENVVSGSGTTQTEKKYSVNIKASGLTYFKLSQTDTDGISETFRVITVDCSSMELTVVNHMDMAGKVIDLNNFKGVYFAQYSDGSTTKHFKN
tara:strand:+ start:10730 stop:11422 length:693 start_codon:yes stop_codon:yes gene_type:complete